MRIEPGTVVAGRYEVERTLGQGGMGAVFQALDRKFGARVALKVAAATGAGHDEFKARFAREARIGHRLGRRRGVVRALDWGELDDGVRLYVALDLVEGARPLTLTCGSREERLRRLLRATEIVADAHRQGVVHRDLKPANLLEDADGELYLADFGLAKVMDEPTGDDGGGALTAPMTRSGLAFGTPLFMAPEQFDDAKRVDARADVYALGVMLHLALTGEYPYPGSDPMSVAIKQQKVLEGMSPAPTPRDRDPGVPEALDRLCARAMAARPDERLASAELLAAGLREHLALPPAVVETVARRDGPPAPAAAVARAEAPTQLEPPPAGPSGPSGPTGDVAAAPTGGAATGGRRLRRVLLSGAGLAALWLLLVVVVQFTGAPAAALLSVLPIAKLVDFTEPGVELEHRPLLGEAWSASRTLVLRGVVADASPDTITLVAGREIGAPQPLRAGQHLQHFEVPVTLSGPGRHGVSLWIRDRADNEAVTGLGIVHHPVQVTLVVTERRGDLAVVQGRLTPAPPGPYVVFGGGQPLRCLEPTFTLEVPVTPDQTVVHLVVRPPFGDALEPRAALP